MNGTLERLEQRRNDVHELTAAFERLDEIDDGMRRELAQRPLERGEVEAHGHGRVA